MVKVNVKSHGRQATARRLMKLLLPLTVATIAVSAQTQPQTQKPGQQTTFRAIAEGVQTSVIVRDSKGQFVPDLKKGEFRVFEDGVEQVLTLFQPIIGGRA